MNFGEFNKTLSQPGPPAGLRKHLESLWYDAKGDWERSHTIIQEIEDADAAWIHAYLHRKEGDTGNADYWYRRAGRKRPALTLQEEWDSIVNTLLQNN